MISFSLPKSKLVNMATILLCSLSLMFILCVGSILLISKSLYDEREDYTQEIIANSLLSGIPYALITNDRATLKGIMDAQAIYEEVYSIEVKDTNGNVLYKIDSNRSKAVKVMKQNYVILDNRDAPLLEEFDSEEYVPAPLGQLTIYFTNDYSESAYRKVMAISISILLFSMFVVLTFTLKFSRTIQRDLKLIMAGLKNIKLGTNYSIEESKIEEFGNIQAMIHATAKGIEEKNNKIKTALQHENEARQSEESSTLYRDDLIKRVSHDIRTPVSIIVGMLQLITTHVDRETMDVTTVDQLDMCLNSSFVLQSIVEELLDFSQFEKLEVSNNAEPTNIYQIRLALDSIYEKSCEEKGLKFVSVISQAEVNEIGFYIVDGKKVIRLLENILDNAVRYTDYGVVTLKFILSENCLTLVVTDTGIGMSGEAVLNIFKKYYRVGKPETTKHSGRGLGLSYVKTICEVLGAEIQVDSKEGVGTSMTVSIPVSVHLPKPEIRDITYCDMSDFNCLIIDNEIPLCKLLSAYLKPYKMSCKYESIPELGYQALIDTTPDIVFVDYHMDGMDGKRLAMRAQSNDSGATTYIAITADHHPDTLNGLKEYFHEVLTKPIDVKQLDRILNSQRTSKIEVKRMLDGLKKDT